MDNNKLQMNKLHEALKGLDYIRPEDIPNIDLYMDQVTTFMNEHLAQYKRHDDDKILTKTMINNYAKNNLLPPPAKKKYSKDHMLLLIFIYYYKNLLNFNDIETLLKPITEQYFAGRGSARLSDIYNEVFSLEHSQMERLHEDLDAKYESSRKTFTAETIPEEDRKQLQNFSFICALSFDVYLKKQLIEAILDGSLED